MKKRQHYFDILKAFFIRHSLEYKTSDSDRKVNRNIYPDAVTCDRMRLLDPKSGQLEPIHHCCLTLFYTLVSVGQKSFQYDKIMLPLFVLL